MTDLKPCPFCGYEEDLIELSELDDCDYGFVLCNKCYARGPSVDMIGGKGHLNRRDYWNNRHVTQEEKLRDEKAKMLDEIFDADIKEPLFQVVASKYHKLEQLKKELGV